MGIKLTNILVCNEHCKQLWDSCDCIGQVENNCVTRWFGVIWGVSRSGGFTSCFHGFVEPLDLGLSSHHCLPELEAIHMRFSSIVNNEPILHDFALNGCTVGRSTAILLVETLVKLRFKRQRRWCLSSNCAIWRGFVRCPPSYTIEQFRCYLSKCVFDVLLFGCSLLPQPRSNAEYIYISYTTHDHALVCA